MEKVLLICSETDEVLAKGTLLSPANQVAPGAVIQVKCGPNPVSFLGSVDNIQIGSSTFECGKIEYLDEQGTIQTQLGELDQGGTAQEEGKLTQSGRK